jgi:surface protein
MSVYNGNNKIKSLYYGNNKIKKAYYGDNLVYTAINGVSFTQDGNGSVTFFINDNLDTYDADFGEGEMLHDSPDYTSPATATTGEWEPSGYTGMILDTGSTGTTGIAVTNYIGILSGFIGLHPNGYPTGDGSTIVGDNSHLLSIDMSSFPTSAVTDMSYMFDGCYSMTAATLNGCDVHNVTTMQSAFHDCRSLQSIDMSSFDTANLISGTNMFQGASSLTSVNLAGWNTTKMFDFSYMFSSCSSLTSVDLSEWNLMKSSQTASYMFADCTSLTNTSFLPNFQLQVCNRMFYDCIALTGGDMTNIIFSGVSMNLDGMFYNCRSLTSLDLSQGCTNPSTSTSMFYGCSALTTINLSNWSGNRTAFMSGAFTGCKSLTSVTVTNCNSTTYNYILTALRANLTGYTWTYNSGVITRS